jgi:hypothetical protein
MNPDYLESAKEHVSKRIGLTPINTDPFDHCIVDNVFPQDILKALDDYWPSDDVLESLGKTGRATSDAYKERQVMLFEERFLEKLAPQQLEFWKGMANIAMSRKAIMACIQKFHSVIQPRLNELGRDAEIRPYLSVVSDRTGYSIGPHTDTQVRLFSMLFYLSTDSKYLNFGTSFYTPKDPNKERFHRAHYPFSDFNLHSSVDYRPNRLLVFPRSDKSFHGVETVLLGGCDRRLLIVNVQMPSSEKD